MWCHYMYEIVWYTYKASTLVLKYYQDLSKFGYIGSSFLAKRQPYTVQSVQVHRESEANGLNYEFTCNYRMHKEISYNCKHIWLIRSIIHLTINKTPNQNASFELNYGWAWTSSAPACSPVRLQKCKVSKHREEF